MPDKQTETRAQSKGATLPEVAIAERMVELWQELGFVRRLSDGGAAPFEWQELAAFADLAGYAISPIEAQCLMDMSRAYVAGLNDCNPFSIAPMERGGDD